MAKTPSPIPARRGDTLPAGYPAFLADVKARIAAARTRAVLAVNSERSKRCVDARLAAT